VASPNVYRCNNPHLPVNDLIIDPFESPFRPNQRIKTHDRVHTPQDETISDNGATPVNNKSENNTNNVLIQSEVASTSVPMNTQFPQSLKSLSQNYEIELIKSALAYCQYNQKKTAQALELTYHQLRGYLKKYNLLDGNDTDE